MKTVAIALSLLLSFSCPAGWRVFWLPNDPSEEVTSYRIWLLRPPFTISVPVGESKTTNFVFIPTMLSSNGVHSVYITAVNTYGESQPSARVTFTNTVPVAGKSAPSVVKSVGVRYEVEP